ncbi:MAG: WbqC-like family protein [Chitinophagaceae bacterium]|nr:WbqC-like family protein [Chitinophagaceae bacterium]
MDPKKSSLLIELHYFPCVHFFSLLNQHDTIVIEAHETFQKQSYRSRTQILSAQKVENLLIPVLSANSHLYIRDIRIDHSQKWRIIHQRAIRSAYGKSPFFEYYSEDILALYDKPVPFLFDFNLEVLTLCLKLLKWKKEITLSSDYQIIEPTKTTDLVDFRGVIHPKKQLQTDFKPYQQVFGRQFEPNLSIIDLLFCEGNNCNPYLTR